MHLYSRVFVSFLLWIGITISGCSSGDPKTSAADAGENLDVGDVEEHKDGADERIRRGRIQPGSLLLEVGEALAIVVEIQEPGNSSWVAVDNAEVMSEDPEILQVHGLELTGVAPGVTWIHVIIGELEIREEVTVLVASPYQVVVHPSEVVLGSTGTIQLTAYVEDRSGRRLDDVLIYWQTEDRGVAVVDAETGLLFANSAGTTTVQAVAQGGVTGSAEVRVESIARLKIIPGGGSFHVNEEIPLLVQALSENDEVLSVNLSENWSVDRVDDARIHQNILVMNAPGYFDVRVEMGGLHKTEIFTAEYVFVELHCGGRLCAAKTSEGIWYVWGDQHHDVLGVLPSMGGSRERYPLEIYNQPDFLNIRYGWWTACGVSTDHKAYCWGYNSKGQTGIGERGFSVFSPEPVVTDLRFQVVEPGYGVTCGLTLEGAVYCWGAYPVSTWRLGVGDPDEEIALLPILVDQGPFVDLRHDYLNPCAQTPEGVWKCFGVGEFGVNGNGIIEDQNKFVPLNTTVALRYLDPQAYSNCGLDQDGKVWCWGTNRYGQLGILNEDPVHPELLLIPTRTAWDHEFVELHGMNGGFRCGVTENREVWCWGANVHCTLGKSNHELVHSHEPIKIDLPKDWKQLSLGAWFGCILSEGGEVSCWGWTPSDEYSDVYPPVCDPVLRKAPGFPA